MSEARWSGELHNDQSNIQSQFETSAEVFHLRKRLWSCDLDESGSPFGLSCFLVYSSWVSNLESTPDICVYGFALQLKSPGRRLC